MNIIGCASTIPKVWNQQIYDNVVHGIRHLPHSVPVILTHARSDFGLQSENLKKASSNLKKASILALAQT